MTEDVYVPGTGNESADIMIVGESPGAREVKAKKPFVGPAGNELDRLLRAAGIDRDDLYITNAVHYQPPGGKGKKKYFFDGGKPTHEYAVGMKELHEDILRVQPKVVVAVGNYALWALTARDSITKWRGSLLWSPLGGGVKVVPTLHPAFIMRGMHHRRPLVIWDLRRAREESATKDLKMPDREIIINPSPPEVLAAVERLKKSEMISIDIETYSPDALACCGFADDPEWAIVIPWTSPVNKQAIREILTNNRPKVAQNSMFEQTMMHRFGIDIVGLEDDTMIAWHFCWPDIGKKDLATITSVLTREPYYKDDIDIWGEVSDKDMLWEYNGKDCCTTLEAWRALDDHELDYVGARKGYDLTMKAFPIMAEATNFGIKGDVDYLMRLKQEYKDRAKKLQDMLEEQIEHSINVNSWKQVGELIYDELGIRERAKRTTKQEVLMDIAAQEKDEFKELVLKSIVHIRHLRKLTSSYVNEDLVDDDGRIRCNWNLAGTRSGRFSASSTYWGSGTSLQTIPSEPPEGDRIRNIFIADEGHTFVGWDLEQAEARVVGYLAEDEELIGWLNGGIDIHRKLASLLPFGVTYEELLKMPKDCRERYIAKTCRHALNYRMGPMQFKATVNKKYHLTGIGLTAAEAKALHARYLELHPSLKLWWRYVEGELSKNGSITNALGRKRRFVGGWNSRLINEAVSFYPQSTIGDMTTLALVRAQERMPWAKGLIHMHDGGIFQVPEDRVDEAKEIVHEAALIPITVNGERLEIPVEMKSGDRWGTLE